MANERKQRNDQSAILLFFLISSYFGFVWAEPPTQGLKCIVCKNCPTFDPKLNTSLSVSCDTDDDEFYCVKSILKNGTINRHCGKEWMCKPPEKLPPNGTVLENHCCQCENCNLATPFKTSVCLWTVLLGFFFFCLFTYF